EDLRLQLPGDQGSDPAGDEAPAHRRRRGRAERIRQASVRLRARRTTATPSGPRGPAFTGPRALGRSRHGRLVRNRTASGPTARRLNGVGIEDTFAEAFKMRAARVIVTAETAGWARTAAALATGYATSVIGCDAEAGLEAELSAAETPGGRPGGRPLGFGFHTAAPRK